MGGTQRFDGTVVKPYVEQQARQTTLKTAQHDRRELL